MAYPKPSTDICGKHVYEALGDDVVLEAKLLMSKVVLLLKPSFEATFPEIYLHFRWYLTVSVCSEQTHIRFHLRSQTMSRIFQIIGNIHCIRVDDLIDTFSANF